MACLIGVQHRGGSGSCLVACACASWQTPLWSGTYPLLDREPFMPAAGWCDLARAHGQLAACQCWCPTAAGAHSQLTACQQWSPTVAGAHGQLTAWQYWCPAVVTPVCARAVHAADIHAQRLHQQAGRGRLQRRPGRNDAAQQGRAGAPAEGGRGALTTGAHCCFTACVLMRDLFRSCAFVLSCRPGAMPVLAERLHLAKHRNLSGLPQLCRSCESERRASCLAGFCLETYLTVA